MDQQCDELTVRFHQYEDSHHLFQLYTGFGLLEKHNMVRCIFNKYQYYRILGYGIRFLTLTLNNKIKLVYDVEDSDRIIPQLLDWCDYYFKRSCLLEKHKSLSSKILPLGLNYFVYGPRMGMVRRLANNYGSLQKTPIKTLMKFLAMHSPILSGIMNMKSGRFVNSIKKFERMSDAHQKPRIIFLTQVWNPFLSKEPNIIEERIEINKMRCNCIRFLRKEFPDQFFGGIAPSEYALKAHKDCVIQDEQIFDKKHYLKRMHESDVGIATMGLFRSNGWKLGEYVAASRAIVSEKLYYDVPNNFKPEKNYLEFSTPEECVNQVHRLVNDYSLVGEMMKENHSYYNSYLRPDRLVWNSLVLAMNGMVL